MKKFIRFIIFLAIVAVALFIFKPDAQNFENWLKESSAKKQDNAKGDNVVERLIDKGVTTATQLQILGTYSYNDHYVFATVDASANGEKIQYLGIATTWIQLP